MLAYSLRPCAGTVLARLASPAVTAPILTPVYSLIIIIIIIIIITIREREERDKRKKYSYGSQEKTDLRHILTLDHPGPAVTDNAPGQSSADGNLIKMLGCSFL